MKRKSQSGRVFKTPLSQKEILARIESQETLQSGIVVAGSGSDIRASLEGDRLTLQMTSAMESTTLNGRAFQKRKMSLSVNSSENGAELVVLPDDQKDIRKIIMALIILPFSIMYLIALVGMAIQSNFDLITMGVMLFIGLTTIPFVALILFGFHKLFQKIDRTETAKLEKYLCELLEVDLERP